jgi:dsDNA-specific endonuclease/ATPase MutS2
MTLDFLRRLFRRKSKHVLEAEIENQREDDFNPFPDTVVVEITDVIDLHSIPPKQIRAVVEDYIEEAYQRGFRFVRIIHGKGIGVQRETVRAVLARKPFVLDFKDAPPEAGGWGATIVTLADKTDQKETTKSSLPASGGDK